MATSYPETVEEIQALVREAPCLKVVGGRTLTALAGNGTETLQVDMTGLHRVLEYQPEEYTFTALAGTRLVEVEKMLAEHGQHLPFDPPFVERGATLGGTVASGLSGSGRYRFGGVRDFILAVQFVDGRGSLARSGGKVVKNAAGFDLSKFLVGSLGQYGILTELTFKVFPQPVEYRTLRLRLSSLQEAHQALLRLAGLSLDLYTLDLQPAGPGAVLLARLGGLPQSFPARLERLQKLVGEGEILEGASEAEFWRGQREFAWLPEGSALVKVPLTAGRLLALDAHLDEYGAQRRYIAAANLAWIAWPGSLAQLDAILTDHELSGLVLIGPSERTRLGVWAGEVFAKRVKAALDPLGKFGG